MCSLPENQAQHNLESIRGRKTRQQQQQQRKIFLSEFLKQNIILNFLLKQYLCTYKFCQNDTSRPKDKKFCNNPTVTGSSQNFLLSASLFLSTVCWYSVL